MISRGSHAPSPRRLSSAFQSPPTRKGIFKITLSVPPVLECLPCLARRPLGLMLSSQLQARWRRSMMLSNNMCWVCTSGGRQSCRSKMQEEKVGNITRDRESLCVCASLSFFFFLVSFVFFQSDPIYKAAQLEKKRGRQYQRLATPQPPAVSVFFADFLPPSPFLRHFSATLTRVTFFLQVHPPHHLPNPRSSKPANRTWQPKNASRLTTTRSEMGLTPIKAPMGYTCGHRWNGGCAHAE